MRVSNRDIDGLVSKLEAATINGDTIMDYYDSKSFLHERDIETFNDDFDALHHSHNYTIDASYFMLAPIKPVLEQLLQLKEAMSVFDGQEQSRSIPIDIPQIISEYIYKQQIKTKIMEIENVKVDDLTPLAKTFKYTGMGKISNEELNQRIAEGQDTFKIGFSQEFKEGTAVVSANCTKSAKGNYFADSYDLTLKQEGKPDMERNYKFRGRIAVKTKQADGTELTEKINPTITLKEAYNQMMGRGVHKTFVYVDTKNPENNRKYDAWEYIDFRNTDTKGNFKTEKFYDLDVDKKLKTYNLVENKDPDNLNELCDSLKRGNIQMAKYINADGSQENIYLEANARHNTINAYDKDMNPINLSDKRQKELQGLGQNGNAEANEQDQKSSKEIKNGAKPDEEDPAKKEKISRKKTKGIA